jgi:hypothetical protein
MKILIWLVCIFIYVLVTAGLKHNGVSLGAIPSVLLFFGMTWLAQTLCRKFDAQGGGK